MALKAARTSTEKAYLDHMLSWSKSLTSRIGDNGFLSASATYSPYAPHWIRDASFVSIGLLDYATFSRNSGLEWESAKSAAHRINVFHCKTIEKHMPEIENAIRTRLEDPDFFKLKSHIPARVGPDGGYYVDSAINDSYQKEGRSGLIQYDSIPLMMHALYTEHKYFGLDETEKEFLGKNIEKLLHYLGKTYFTECANMWEMETNVIHSYDVAAIYSAFEIAKKMSDEGLIQIKRQDIDSISSAYFPGGPIEFLKKFFIRDNIIYREKASFAADPDISKSVDIAAIYLFTMFGINDKVLKMPGVEAATMSEIDKVLFSSNMLPIRFIGDEYFKGGRWLNVGAEFSKYLLSKGDDARAMGIVDYIIGKYGDKLPEQEIVNPASPNAQDPYLSNNGNMPIDDLAWSYAAMLSTVSYFLGNRMRENAEIIRH